MSSGYEKGKVKSMKLINNQRHCTREEAIELNIIQPDDTTTDCKLWWDEYIYIDLYTWDDLYERADGTAYGDPELKAKDNARFILTGIIEELKGYNIDDCEIPEEEIDYFLENADRKYLFDEDGNLVE